MLQAEADWLLSQGLGLRASCRDLLVFGENGPIENQLRFPDECVRHKLLDLMGDLALAGCQLVGRFSATEAAIGSTPNWSSSSSIRRKKSTNGNDAPETIARTTKSRSPSDGDLRCREREHRPPGRDR